MNNYLLNKMNVKKTKILIIGSIPPPIGGITIHVSRLLDILAQIEFPYSFVSIKKEYKTLFKSIITHKVIHLHVSNPKVRFFLSIICFFTLKKIIISYHGNIKNFKRIDKLFNYLSILFANYPIVLNEQSLLVAKKWNTNSMIISSFIPPIKIQELSDDIYSLLDMLRDKYATICSTNAFDLIFDKKKQEVYGISFLIDIFKYDKERCLLISDPSGNYKSYIQSKCVIPSNVYFISQPHSYFELLKEVDIMIRATTTDGDSLSIKEALYLGKKVICSDVVSRPKEVITYKFNNKDEFIKVLNDNKSSSNSDSKYDGSSFLVNLYKKLIV
ncbi:hypothetical protein [Dysgonomonas reticulitermitis]